MTSGRGACEARSVGVPDSGVVVAVPGLDCASKLRVTYRLPRTIGREWLGRFDDGCCRTVVHEFSGIVDHAFDHATVTRGDQWMARTILGQADVVVTFYRSRRRDLAKVVERFEKVAFEGIGDIVRRTRPGQRSRSQAWSRPTAMPDTEMPV